MRLEFVQPPLLFQQSFGPRPGCPGASGRISRWCGDGHIQRRARLILALSAGRRDLGPGTLLLQRPQATGGFAIARRIVHPLQSRHPGAKAPLATNTGVEEQGIAERVKHVRCRCSNIRTRQVIHFVAKGFPTLVPNIEDGLSLGGTLDLLPPLPKTPTCVTRWPHETKPLGHAPTNLALCFGHTKKLKPRGVDSGRSHGCHGVCARCALRAAPTGPSFSSPTPPATPNARRRDPERHSARRHSAPCAMARYGD